MDKVRAFANVVWTQRFWVLSVLCMIVCVVCWNMATGDLDTQFKARKGKIDGAFSSVNTIQGTSPHPNDNVNAGDMEQAKQQKAYVLKVWQELYDRQRTEVLYWPESISKDFVEYMEKRKFGDDIKTDMRGFYHNYIEQQFDVLIEKVKAKKIAARGSARGGGYGGEMGGYGGSAGVAGVDGQEKKDYLVLWLDQGKLQQKLAFKTKPKSMKVWVTQEDLWVYETLLDVIAKTNKERGATRPGDTAVRAIMTLQVGSEASNKSMGRVLIPKPAEGAGEMGGYGGEMGGYGGEMGGYGGEMGGDMGGYGGEMGGYGGEMGGYGGEMGGMGGGGASLTANRYLDAEGKPDPGGEEGGSYGTTEFRQLPIRMKLKMDQRWIPRVLIECANAALPIEVKQVRINASQSGSGVTGKSGGSRAASKGLGGMAPDPNLAEVEISGVVYIYNEPDTETLTVPGETDESI